MVWLVAWCLVTLGFVFLAREAEATDWLRRGIKQRAVVGRSSKGHLVARFLDAMLECAPCVSAWACLPAAALVAGLYLLADNPWVVVMLVVACPVGAVGLLYALTVVSPVQAVKMLGMIFANKGKGDGAKGKDPTG